MHDKPSKFPFTRFAMRALPSPFVQRMIDALMRRMRSVHPRLFSNLERLDAATVLIEPLDVRHRFVLTFGGGESLLEVAQDNEACDATIKGRLSALLDMLEGRIDGDKLFFSRELEISGNTAVVVALRNTLDREEINLLGDATSLLGPFADPARKVIVLADAFAERMRAYIQVRAQNRNDDCAALRKENEELKERLAKYNSPRRKHRKAS